MSSNLSKKRLSDDTKKSKLVSKTKVAKSTKAKPKKKAKKLSKKKIDKLILDNLEQGQKMAWKLLNSWRVTMKKDEVDSIVGAALCEAAPRFEPERGVNFNTFFFYHLRGMLIKEITKKVEEQKVCQYVPQTLLSDDLAAERYSNAKWTYRLVDNNNPERILEKREMAGICWTACKDLDELEQEVLFRHYTEDQSLVDIANDLEYCRCHISRVKSRAIKKLRNILGPSYKHLEQNGMRSIKTTKVNKKYTGGRGRRKQGVTRSSLKESNSTH